MSKIDFKKELKTLYRPSKKEFELIEVPEMQFLMIDGKGDPNTSAEYTEAIQMLYPLAYRIKFISKKELDRDYVVPPLEGLWWVADMRQFSVDKKSEWLWTMMIMQPDWIEAATFERARVEVAQKKGLPGVERIRLEKYHEGLSVQIMYLGSYADEAPTLKRMHDEFIPSQGLQMAGKHHEIYLSDPRKVAPERLKTILRQPVIKQTA